MEIRVQQVQSPGSNPGISFMELLDQKRALAAKEVLTDSEREQLRAIDEQLYGPSILTPEQQIRQRRLAEEILK